MLNDWSGRLCTQKTANILYPAEPLPPFALSLTLPRSREKWEEARDHAMRAVVADSRMRAWYADREAAQMGLLFACRLGR